MLSYLKSLETAGQGGQAPLLPILQNVSRRHVLAGLGGFVVAMQLVAGKRAEAFESYEHGGLNMPHGVVDDPHVFVSIAADGTVTIMAIRSEMGTGSKTSLPMVIADEMEADWSRVKILQAPGDEPRYGNQDTDGSRSMRHHIQPARQMGAAVRRMLEQAAAEKWGVPVDQVRAVDHQVVHRSLGRRMGYGELAEAAMALPTPPKEDLRFKDEKEFRYIGKGTVQIYDLHDITTGKAVYGGDVMLPGMKFAAVARPPVVGGKVASLNGDGALAVKGVSAIEQLPGTMPPAKFSPQGGVAVIADSTWAALKGRDALVIEWDDGPNAVYDSEAYREALQVSASRPGKVVRNEGDAERALASAAKIVTRSYYAPHLAHAPMEPPVAVARVADGRCEVWAPVQSPYGTRLDIADALGMDEKDVTVNVTLLGGGFGRKSKCDFAIEAALLSQKVGAPVRVQWTREDDIRHGFYHTVSVEQIELGLDENDTPVAWRHRSAAPSFLSTFVPDSGYQHPIEVGMGLADNPFDIPNFRCEDCEAFAHTRIGWYRAVSNIPRAFAVQSFAAEVAVELGRDQKEVLLELLGPPRIVDMKKAGVLDDFWNYGEPYSEFPNDTGRLRKVVELAAEKAGWGKELPKGEGMGIAVHRSFVSCVAAVVRAKVDENGRVTVPEVHMAVDCGFVANPERIRSQMQGACVFGMTAALYGNITFENGRVVQSNFHDYEMVRSDNFPMEVHTHIVPNGFEVHATGIGEPGVPPLLPALTNAIYNASGKRIRDLPIGYQLEG